MKTFIPSLLAALVASVLTLVLAPHLRPTSQVAEGSQGALPNTNQAARPGDSPKDDNSENEMTLAAIQDLRMEVATLRADMETRDSRQPMTLPEEAVEAQEALASLGNPEQRSLILSVLEQKEADEQRARDEARQQRDEERRLARADEIAEKLGLNRADRDVLLSVMTETDNRRGLIITEMRENGFGDRDAMREGMQGLQDWRNEELNSRFGEDLTGQINELDNGGGRGFGGRGGGGQGGGGQGGGGQGGGGRGGGRGGN